MAARPDLYPHQLLRIRSWRPAIPSISGPRSTVASNLTVTPCFAGPACSWFILLSSPDLSGLKNEGSLPSQASCAVAATFHTCVCQIGRTDALKAQSGP